MKEVYADFNNIEADGALSLACVGSVESIAALEDGLEEGEEICLTDGELRARGRVFRRRDGLWEVRPGWTFVS